MERLRIRIIGTPCSTCIIPIRKALEKTNGVKTVGANYFADLILVDYDENVIDKAMILAVIKKAGYDAITIAAPYW
ncbi:heavy-metal-associated domain-containing protein [[Eubacterium] cellulosolvens]